ncbi:MAG: YdeI/OmpD-associated family protein [Acidimicrobiia bacterium]
MPFDPKVVFGKARAAVIVTVNGHVPFRTTTMLYGGTAYVGLRKDQLREFGVAAGDGVQVTVDLDAAPRVVEVPAELAAAFKTAPDVAAYFESLSFTHRKEYARWVAEAKKQETRDARASKAIQMLRDRVRTPG